MDMTLSDEHVAVRALAAEFVDREVMPHAAAWDRAESVDTGIASKLGDLGFLGLTIDEKYGGSGGDHLAYCLVLEELGRGDSSVRGIVSVSLGLVSEASVRAANNALQVFGGYGYIDEYPVGKYLRDARVTTLYEGTSQIQQLVIGRALTGVNAFA
jgi:alkylation response protein AidB-like acyl-CoA dehydrogenase